MFNLIFNQNRSRHTGVSTLLWIVFLGLFYAMEAGLLSLAIPVFVVAAFGFLALKFTGILSPDALTTKLKDVSQSVLARATPKATEALAALDPHARAKGAQKELPYRVSASGLPVVAAPKPAAPADETEAAMVATPMVKPRLTALQLARQGVQGGVSASRANPRDVFAQRIAAQKARLAQTR